MASEAVTNPPPTESKSARKKKAKAGATPAVPATDKTTSELETASSDAAKAGDGENAYVKELQKQIRNINKKLNAMQKVNSILESNPGVSLDDLVAQRKMNADQKASAQKKPALQQQLAQLEEQLAHYKKFDHEYQQKIAQEKEILQQSHAEELEKLRETLKAEAAAEQDKILREKLLTLSRFLRAAAARRALEDDGSELSQAFEGALLLVYGGDASAVTAAVKLIEGSDESVPSTEGELLSVNYAQIKQTSLEEAPFAAEEAWVENVAQANPNDPESEASTIASTDPTIAHAGLTEIQPEQTLVNEETEAASSAPAATDVDTGAANAAAAEQWDKAPHGADDPLAESFEMVPRDPAETESPAATAPVGSTQSWADQSHDAGHAPAASTNGTHNEGFAEVSHQRGGRGRGGFAGAGDGRGGFRGRGGQRGDGGRGRGQRGGRGRGEFRGGARGSFRGAPRGGAESQ